MLTGQIAGNQLRIEPVGLDATTPGVGVVRRVPGIAQVHRVARFDRPADQERMIGAPVDFIPRRQRSGEWANQARIAWGVVAMTLSRACVAVAMSRV